MMSSNYTIHHFDLSRPCHAVAGGTSAHYCVFWYRSIPLGECYLTSSELGSQDVFRTRCMDAIWPTLQHYLKKSPGLHVVKPSPPTYAAIEDVCKLILSAFEPEAVPEVCDVSVVICTRNRAASLRKCLQHLQLQHCRPAEIIVVDNASDTTDTKTVSESFVSVKYIREDRLGLDVARNTGARAATQPVILYTDDDTLPDAYWVYRVYETFQDTSVHAMTGLVLAASLETEAEVIFEKYWPFNRGYITKLYDDYFFTSTLQSGPPVWEIGAGANMAFRKELFEEVGYFDERLDVGAAGCSGDSELWYRILANGFAIQYNPLAIVHHNHRSSIEGLKRQLYGYMRGFTVAILIQHQRFGHTGNLQHLLKVLRYYALRVVKGFPLYAYRNQSLFPEVRGLFSGMIYYLRHRNTDPRIFS